MATERIPDLRLFFDIPLTLDRIDVRYMINEAARAEIERHR